MTGKRQRATVGELPTPTDDASVVPTVLTWLVWTLWVVAVGVLAAGVWTGETVARIDVSAGTPFLAVDGLTLVMWVAVTFFSGVVHSYARRYVAGSRTDDRFFGLVFAFTLVVAVLVAADHFLPFVGAWLLMGLVMSRLIAAVDGWPQASAAGSFARRYFLASSALVGVAVGTVWWATGAVAVSELPSTLGAAPSPVVSVVAATLLLAAAIQSALLPFHGWLLSSMTAPTPASALMHAGFVNAGGVLLVRFAPVVTAEAWVMLAVVVVGTVSALGGKFLKTVQTDVKGRLGCSTVGQMGFMILQAGLGFFGAAITHLVLHGFYKAYQFLASGSRVTHEHPSEPADRDRSTGALGVVVALGTALAGGALFAALTGKGTEVDAGLLLTGLVVLTVLHAVREAVRSASLPAAVRYGAVPLVALPAIAVYAATYRVVEGLLDGLPAVGQPAELTAAHAIVAGAFLATYLAVETEVYQRSERLYVLLSNATRPASDTVLTNTEEYDEY
ncbi:proton-conducting transporter membrane subunit [Halobaculum sp. MBLA0147]|uniref:proton-conducting transporter transmembrane domain-containing protein n=1 Tax=Halobaculum sp. MBLA0147 TaxID=3079934 RepID=UPI003524A68C